MPLSRKFISRLENSAQFSIVLLHKAPSDEIEGQVYQWIKLNIQKYLFLRIRENKVLQIMRRQKNTGLESLEISQKENRSKLKFLTSLDFKSGKNSRKSKCKHPDL